MGAVVVVNGKNQIYGGGTTPYVTHITNETGNAKPPEPSLPVSNGPAGGYVKTGFPDGPDAALNPGDYRPSTPGIFPTPPVVTSPLIQVPGEVTPPDLKNPGGEVKPIGDILGTSDNTYRALSGGSSGGGPGYYSSPSSSDNTMLWLTVIGVLIAAFGLFGRKG